MGSPAYAARGAPGSPEFGIGARVSIQAGNTEAAASLVADLKPDWISIEVDWKILVPEPGIEPDWNRLDSTIFHSKIANSLVMLSLTNPPAWAMTANGPDPSITADFISALIAQCGMAVDAIELFPAPNTSRGWGASPDPGDYFVVFQAVNQRLNQEEHPVLLIAGGLDTNITGDDPAAWTDLDFLTGLYEQGANTAMQVIGLRFSAVNGLPSAHPSKGQNSVLRHYEDIRRLMTSNGHISGIIWITYLGFPTGTSQLEQTEWLSEAYPQIRTQLYIGAAFLQGINTCNGTESYCSEVSLLNVANSEHPFTPVLRGILAHNNPRPQVIPGKGKSTILRKPR
jgi:hypothetical protein